MFEEFIGTDGTWLIAGHKFDPRTMRCVNLREGAPCNRKVNDILSDALRANVGEPHIACYGTLTPHELETLRRAYDARTKAFEIV